MSILIHVLEKEIEKLKESLKDDLKNSDSDRIKDKIKHKEKEINKLKLLDFEEVSKDMKSILLHTKAVEQKYECKTVKFMYKFSEFLEKYVSKEMAKNVNEYTMKKIHAPVCSIVAGTVPDLPPMPVSKLTSTETLRSKDLEDMQNVINRLNNVSNTSYDSVYNNISKWFLKPRSEKISNWFEARHKMLIEKRKVKTNPTKEIINGFENTLKDLNKQADTLIKGK